MIWYDEKNYHFCGILPENSLPQCNNKNAIRQIPIEGHSAKYLTSTSHNCQSHQKQGKSEKQLKGA